MRESKPDQILRCEKTDRERICPPPTSTSLLSPSSRLPAHVLSLCEKGGEERDRKEIRVVVVVEK